MSINVTRIRYVKSKDIDKIIKYINHLPYKVELKGGIQVSGKKFYQTFVLPETKILNETISGDLDRI